MAGAGSFGGFAVGAPLGAAAELGVALGIVLAAGGAELTVPISGGESGSWLSAQAAHASTRRGATVRPMIVTVVTPGECRRRSVVDTPEAQCSTYPKQWPPG
jgi:hypothetical protein